MMDGRQSERRRLREYQYRKYIALDVDHISDAAYLVVLVNEVETSIHGNEGGDYREKQGRVE